MVSKKKAMTFTLPPELLNKLKELSDESLIPQSRLVEKAIKLLMDSLKEE